MREAVRGALDAVPERQAFLLGGVTFCGLVPQRSIPFRVVCLLGMNEGEFPRPGNDAGLNKILSQPRRGDRDTRSEDRYLFLEALMSARDVLHISYVGEGVRDGKPRNPAAPLAELLQFLDEQHAIAADDKAERPWRIRHPLQPFDARYYERDAHGQPRHDPRLFSYDPAFLARAVRCRQPAVSRQAGRHAGNDSRQRNHARRAQALLARSRQGRLAARPGHQPAGTGRQRLAGSRAAGDEAGDASNWSTTGCCSRHSPPASDQLPAEPPAWLAHSGLLAGGAIGAQSLRAIARLAATPARRTRNRCLPTAARNRWRRRSTWISATACA